MEAILIASRFIVFEGLDGAGKSSIVKRVEKFFTERGRKVLIVVDPPLIEPWSELKDYFERGQKIDKIAEAFMLVAARVDNSRRIIREAITDGKLVLADRYYPSWLAYQQVRLSDTFKNPEIARMFLRSLQSLLETYELIVKPDHIFFLEGNLNIFAERLIERDKGSKYDHIGFQRKVMEEYRLILQNEQCPVTTIDTTVLSLDATVQKVLSSL